MKDGIAVCCEPVEDGYAIGLSIGEDRSIILDRDQAEEYALAVLRTVMHARYDAAVIKQMRHRLKQPDQSAAHVVESLRLGRADARADDAHATAPLTFVPGVSAFTGEPFVQIRFDGNTISQLDIQNATTHALGVLQVRDAVDCDTDYYRFLTTDLKIGKLRARNVIEDVALWYDDHPTADLKDKPNVHADEQN